MTARLPKKNPPPSELAAPRSARLSSLDAYRGLVMFLMMAEVLQFARVSESLPQSAFWKFLAHEQTHAPWLGCSLHDLIQPSFSFIVGVALPFSLAGRLARGQTRRALSIHAWWRAGMLAALGVILRSISAGHVYWTFEDTLSQIGMGYGFLFLLAFCPPRGQWLALGLILFGYWLAFALYPVPANFDYHAVGVRPEWPFVLPGFAAHWNKNSNLAWAFDTWFLNLFPRSHPFRYNAGGYTTLAFIPTLATMILGLLAGEVLRGPRSPRQKVIWLVVAGLICLAIGAALSAAGICPSIKRVWTPSWSLYSGGWCLFLLAAFYSVIEILEYKRWAFPLVIIGVNSIAAYCLAQLSDDFLGWVEKRFPGIDHLSSGPPLAPLFEGAVVLLFFWMILYLLYRKKIFLRL